MVHFTLLIFLLLDYQVFHGFDLDAASGRDQAFGDRVPPFAMDKNLARAAVDIGLGHAAFADEPLAGRSPASRFMAWKTLQVRNRKIKPKQTAKVMIMGMAGLISGMGELISMIDPKTNDTIPPTPSMPKPWTLISAMKKPIERRIRNRPT